MLIGFLLPLLRRLSARMRLLTGLGVTAAGLALALSLLLRGHASGSVLLIRVGLLLTIAGLALLASGARGAHRGGPRAGQADQRDDKR